MKQPERLDKLIKNILNFNLSGCVFIFAQPAFAQDAARPPRYLRRSARRFPARVRLSSSPEAASRARPMTPRRRPSGSADEDLLKSGDSGLSETLADLPQLTSTTNDSTVTGNTQNSGLSRSSCGTLATTARWFWSTVAAPCRTAGITNLVSLSTIPTDFVDRVEIITGGTSSIYGSDAVAGVVNIITKTKERGLTCCARTGITPKATARN